MRRIYSLEDDRERIADLQHAALHSKTTGVLFDIAIVGSPEWFSAIRAGLIPEIKLSGKVIEIFDTGHHGSFPEMKIQTETGITSSWERLGDPKSYKKNDDIEIHYVVGRYRKIFLNEVEAKLVTEIFCNNSNIHEK